MLKKIADLSPEEDVLLLESFASGEVDEDSINENTLFACGYKDYFLSLMVAASPGNENMNIICLGEAVKARAEVSIMKAE